MTLPDVAAALAEAACAISNIKLRDLAQELVAP